jgi:hypothetical protein
VIHWPAWNGDVMKLAFHPKHELYRSLGREYAQEFNGKPDSWDQLIQELMDAD